CIVDRLAEYMQAFSDLPANLQAALWVIVPACAVALWVALTVAEVALYAWIIRTVLRFWEKVARR
ncbi:MAG: hypothetical protein GY767_17895, partial [Shimia sp.]|nr:hypothetical protein [Shimia sp.]